MVSNNVIMTMVATAMILLGTALVLYASWMFMMKDTCTCTGQTTLAGGGGQTTVNAASTKEPVTLAPCVTTFKRIDQSSPTCYKAVTKTSTDAPIDQFCKNDKTGSKLAVVDTPADNTRVQAFIDSQSYNTGFFYVGVKKVSNNWVKSDGSTTIVATDSFFDQGQIEGAGPSAFMKKKGNGFWYQNDGQSITTVGFYLLCQI